MRSHPAHRIADREDKVRVGRALPAGRARQRADPQEGQRRHQLAGPHVRPDRRPADRTRLHRADRRRRAAGSPTTAGCWPGSTARATCWSPSVCAAGCGRAFSPPSWPRCSRRWSSSRAAATARPRRTRSTCPRQAVRRALAETRRLSGQLRADEHRHRINPSREPDEGFVAAVYRWATTGDLAAALAASDVTGIGHAAVGGRLRALVPPGARPARPGAQRRTRPGAAQRRETRHRRRPARRRCC